MRTGDDLQSVVVETGIEVFGEKNTRDPDERTLRFAEEAIELIRARGMPFQQLAALVCHEYYGRTAGDERKEIGDVVITLFSLADSLNVDAIEAAYERVDAVLANKKHARSKHNAKPKQFITAEVA